MDAASSPDRASSTRATVNVRPLIKPEMWPDESAIGYSPDDPYVRRYWSAAIGPGAVADLLRLMVSASKKQSVRRPKYLSDLAREGLVLIFDDRVWVRCRIPPLPTRHIRRLHPSLREELAERIDRSG